MIAPVVIPSAADALAHLEAGLQRLGAGRADIVQSADAAVGLDPESILLGVGSVAEGLGTSKSDFDLILIRADDGDSDTRTNERSWTVGRCIVDLKTVRAADVADLIGRLRAWAASPWNITRAADFTFDERVLLHRLLRGCQLFPAYEGDAASSYRPPAGDLARLKLQVARHLARTIQVDMVGYRDGDDFASLVFAAQELLGHAVDGLLAGHHLTNPTAKWRSRLLGSLPPDWSDPVMTRPPRLSADSLFWRLHRAPAEPERGAAVTHASRCTTFARAAFAWAEPRLVEPSAFEPPRLAWDREPSESQAAALPSLELDVDFRLAGGRATVARLNEFGRPLDLSERELAVLLLFDGTTSAAEAAAAVDHVSRDDVDRLVRLVSEASLGLVGLPGR